jgi:hypothetical protein
MRSAVLATEHIRSKKSAHVGTLSIGVKLSEEKGEADKENAHVR